MAGSFDVFRKYQRSLLVGVAILAMLAFFVLPPILDMAPSAGPSDPLAATWRGGGIREAELQRAVALRIVVNQFLREAAVAASDFERGRVQVLGEDEADVVRTLLLAREAEANGIVVGNDGVNRFLAQWTNDRVRPQQLEALIAGRRMGSASVSSAEVFATLRTAIAAERMRQLFISGLGGDPPGAAWDIFRRLEQEATIEVVPVVVESLAAEVDAPAEADLRSFFDRFKDRLPVDRSPDPGFMEPHRISYQWLLADRRKLETAAAKDVTDAEIEAAYEKDKERLYRAKPAPAKDQDAETKDDAASKDDADSKKQAESKDGAADKDDAKDKDEGQSKDEAEPKKDAEPGFEPLEKVRDDVRDRLAAAAVKRRLDEVFAAVSGDLVGYSRDLARWKADRADEAVKPQPPNIDAIAEKQGLEAARAQKRTAGQAAADGGVGATFQLPDPRSGMGFEPIAWTDLFFAPTRLPWRPGETIDVAGNRYLSWKTEDFPAFVPEFADVRADVERAWRIVEARPRAEAVAKELAAAAAGGKSLADAVAGRQGPKLEATTVGPFAWLSRGSATFGSPATVSQPEGLEMPGDDLMRAVFALEPGGTAVAFNDPRTVCYAIRLVSYAPAEDELRTRFVDPTLDRRRMDEVANRDRGQAVAAWMADIEKRSGLEWKRPPQQP